MAEWTVEPAEAGRRLDRFLGVIGRLGSRGRAFDALARGKVFLNGREAAAEARGVRLVAGDIVRVWMDRPGTSKRRATLGDRRDLPIVYEDDAVVVLNKPAGLLAVPLERREGARSVFEDLDAYLRARSSRQRPLVVHRIDRDTSGLVVFAKDAAAQSDLKAQFKSRQPERVYLAVVYGHPTAASGTWRDRLAWDRKALIQRETHATDARGKEAVCHYRVIETLRGASLIEVSLVTGRRNQIRLQAGLRGHMLVGERRYTHGPDSRRPIAFRRQALHAHRLRFLHPRDGRELAFEAPLPADLADLLERLRRG
jgi:23S rRNA pseudouridine1911/1915/1917 synthase